MGEREMSKKQRLETAFSLREPDRTPILGGWIACPAHIMALAETTEDEYWADPTGVSIRAYDRLGMDGLMGVFVPKHRGGYRFVDRETYTKSDAGVPLEQTVAAIDAMPTAEAIERGWC